MRRRAGDRRSSGEVGDRQALAKALPTPGSRTMAKADAAEAGGNLGYLAREADAALAAHEEFLGKACETEELKRRLGESRGKLRELAAKLARNG